MALISKKTSVDILTRVKWFIRRDIRTVFTGLTKAEMSTESVLKSDKKQPLEGRLKVAISSESVKKQPSICRLSKTLCEFRHNYLEFLPNPNQKWRNNLREKLEREDMVKRRKKIDIPEFYVGSILEVTTSDLHTKESNRFEGICIERKGFNLTAQFTLRNVVENEAVEICYDLYDPTILQIKVLRFDKNLYIRKALPEFSAPLNMHSAVHAKPKSWLEIRECKNSKCVKIEENLRLKDKDRQEIRKEPWEKQDLMKQYRKTVTEEEQREIWNEVNKHLASK